jgi:hypothetical protein
LAIQCEDASFTFYAVLSTYDWSTVVPTPTTSPAQNFVDIFSNQTIGGAKTFTGNLTLQGTVLGRMEPHIQKRSPPIWCWGKRRLASGSCAAARLL